MARAALSLAFLLSAAALAGCVEVNTTAPGTETGGVVTVDMVGMAYDPVELVVAPGTTVLWVNRDAVGHTVTPTDKGAWGTQGSGDDPTHWLQKGERWSWTFDEEGEFEYYCIPHAALRDGEWVGMVAKVIVREGATGGSGGDGPPIPAARATDTDEVGRSASDVPAPLPPGGPTHRYFDLESREVVAEMADGSTFSYWTFDGTVPGPMLRVREGDTVTINHTNAADSAMGHNIDLHAVTGPGGGAHALDARPGETASLTFRALEPGLFVYHCAYEDPPLHVAHGMYGLILVEPAEGLPEVDREFYVMQGDFYSPHAATEAGHHEHDAARALDERPIFVVFNGRMGSLTDDRRLEAEVGDTLRIFVGNGGPGLVSSFHVIGEVFERVHAEGSLTTPPLEHVQTTLVPAGGAAVVEFSVEVPGDYLLVDHSLYRVHKGAAGVLHVEGEAEEGVFEPGG